jgi:hypothetical protein
MLPPPGGRLAGPWFTPSGETRASEHRPASMLRASLPLYGRRANRLRGGSIVRRKTSLAEIYSVFRNYGRPPDLQRVDSHALGKVGPVTIHPRFTRYQLHSESRIPRRDKRIGRTTKQSLPERAG